MIGDTIISMRKTRIPVSVTLDPDLVDLIDRQRGALGSTRSALMEDWLREAARRHAVDALDLEIERYYRDRSDPERADDDAIAGAAGLASTSLEIDKSRRRPRRRPRARS